MLRNDTEIPLPPSTILERKISCKSIEPSRTVTTGASKPTISTSIGGREREGGGREEEREGGREGEREGGRDGGRER